MIPDKIYLGIQDLGSGYVYALSLDNNGEQEYIRKDALLKMLDEAITHLSDGSLAGYYESLAYQDIKEKIQSL